MSFVIDASVVLAWLLPDEKSATAERLIGRTTQERVCAPALLMLEVGNALLQAERRSRIAAADRNELIGAFTALPIALEPISADSLIRAGALAKKHGLSLYDGCYLELAAARACALATFDRGLAQAASRAGIALVEDDRSQA